MSALPHSSVSINGNFLASNGSATLTNGKSNLITVVKVGSPPQWGEDARSLTSFQTFPRSSHSRTTSEVGASSSVELNPLSGEGRRTEGGKDIITVVIPLTANDRRFGFSVIGGVDERFAPKIEAINAGSPADRADIEVGDEILEVNGKPIDKCTHTEVISHIHQCIRNRSICLKVRRPTKTETRGATLPSTNGNYIPSQLSAPSTPTAKDSPGLNVPTAKELEDALATALEAPPPLEFASPSPENGNHLNDDVIGIGHISHNIQHSIDDNSAVMLPEFEPVQHQSGPSPLSIPVPSPRRSSEKLLNRAPQINLSILEPPAPISPLPLTKPPLSPLTKLPPLTSLNHSPLPSPTSLNLPSPTSLSLPRPTLELNSGTHREMAVDVPDAFVPVAKTAPRYPPMKPAMDTLTRNLEGSNSKIGEKGRVLRSTVLGGPSNGTSVQEQQMEMFLRSSIRQSKKLRDLEKFPVPPLARGVVNNAFEPEQSLPSAEHLPSIKHIPVLDVTKLYDVGALQSALNRVIDYVGSENAFSSQAPDVTKIMDLLKNEEFQGCLTITNIIKQILCSQVPPAAPVRCDAQQLFDEIAQIPELSDNTDGEELLAILSSPNITALIDCHDRISKIFGAPKNPPVNPPPAPVPQTPQTNGTSNRTAAPATQKRLLQPPPELQGLLDEGEHLKVIQIDKTTDPLGATVRNEGESIIVGRIVKGGAAEKSGLLHEGDEILTVNGIEMRGKTVAQVSDELASMQGKLTMAIIPNDRYSLPPVEENTQPTAIMHIKAHFDYDPEEDMYIPCRELGIAFEKGDILHVINTGDPNWWQAYKEGEDENSLAGLIPSKSFQQQRESIKQSLMGSVEERGSQGRRSRFLCTPTMAKKSLKASRKGSKGKMYCSTVVDDSEPMLYEEVALYYPRANRKRPVVLIGPSNIGRHELRTRLMEDTTRFAAAIPHTSRPRKDIEADGADYHFISRAQFEGDILNGRFVEHGEYEKNYYGTSLSSIRSVVNSGKMCVLNLHPESLKILKRSDLKPYVIFVAPPSLEKLRQNRVKVGASVKTDELKEIIERAREIEEKYGAFLDSVIINHDQERAYRELLKEVSIIEREPQWVPKVWLDYSD